MKTRTVNTSRWVHIVSSNSLLVPAPALLLYVRQDDLEGKPRLKKLLQVAVVVSHVHLATQKDSSDEFRKKHLDALVVYMDSKLDASRPELPLSVVAKAKSCVSQRHGNLVYA